MDINKDYTLNDTSYFKRKFKKQQIVIGNSLTVGLNHYDDWNKKMSGKFKRTSPYTIGLDGTIYEHYNPIYYSSFLRDDVFDKKIISIVLENEGWVTKDFNKKTFITWNGDIYNRKEPLVEKKWRGKLRWAPYSDEQMESLSNLCNYLIEEFNLDRTVSSDNIKINDFAHKKGVYYRSNYSRNFLDVSPAFDFDYLIDKI
jgi:hypothetical protein